MNLTCATYNILHGYHREMIVNNIRFLIKEGAHVICLQEAEVDFEDALKTLLAEPELSHWKMESGHAGRNGDVAILWSEQVLTLRKSLVVSLPKLRTPTTLELLQGHTKTNQRAAIIVEFDWHGHVLQVTNAHLSWEGGSRHRLRQLKHLRAELEKTPADFRIITGDFNTISLRPKRGKQEKRVEKILGTEFRNAFPKLPWTYDISSTYPQDSLQFIGTLSRAGVKWRQRFDYMFAKDMTVMEAKMHDLPGSDHRPLIATFGLSGTEKALP